MPHHIEEKVSSAKKTSNHSTNICDSVALSIFHHSKRHHMHSCMQTNKKSDKELSKEMGPKEMK
jgi:hypothetical protein